MKDNFSQQAAGYAKYRPQYPETLFTYIVDFVKAKKYRLGLWYRQRAICQTTLQIFQHRFCNRYQPATN